MRNARRRISQAPRSAERDLDDAIYLACAVDGHAHLLTTETLIYVYWASLMEMSKSSVGVIQGRVIKTRTGQLEPALMSIILRFQIRISRLQNRCCIRTGVCRYVLRDRIKILNRAG